MSPASSPDLAGRRVLLVEDQFLIAMDLEAMLHELGASVVDTATTVADALSVIERWPPAIAMLDLKLKDGTTAPIAETLRARGIPFIFATGYGDLSSMPAPLRGAPLLRKPIDIVALGAALASLEPK